MTLKGTVSLNGPEVTFEMEIDNHGGWTVTSVDWPIIGSLSVPSGSPSMEHLTASYGSWITTSLWPAFDDERGYYGTNYPIQMNSGRYDVVLAGMTVCILAHTIRPRMKSPATPSSSSLGSAIRSISV